MTGIANAQCDSQVFHLSWHSGDESVYPHIWLRDNDPGELHPDTRERLFDLTTVSLDIQPEAWRLSEETLVVSWPDKASESVYRLDWLYAHQPGRHQADAARVARCYWRADELPDIPRFNAATCKDSPPALLEALQSAKRSGLVIFDGLEQNDHAGEHLGELIGFKRQTNFGTLFEVRNKPSPNNLAYTALALPLHTDLPNQEQIPGYQFLHCCRNSAVGGASVFADGFRICEDLKNDAPEEFALLSSAHLPWRFHDERDDVRYRRPIIALDSAGELCGLAFNAHIADVPDIAPDQLLDFYKAYRGLMLRIRAPQYRLCQTLQPGEMVMFDNRRVLHGREAFDSGSGDRHLRGFYIEHNEVDSRIRMLAS